MSLFIGLMSGTSMDGVDAALARIDADGIATLGAAFLAFPPALRAELMALQAAGSNEIEREALAANGLARVYADCVTLLLEQSGHRRDEIGAVAVHGQTIRHRPELGFTRQTNNPALLAELCGINVIADFRSRDVAAGGQGAPLVPAFHHALFSHPGQTRVVANIGGIANISILSGENAGAGAGAGAGADSAVRGFDTGPGNALLDGWIQRHLGREYDQDGAWGATGQLVPALLASLLREPYFALPAPKSTGRDLFHMAWLEQQLSACPAAASASPADIQHTLAALTAHTLAQAIRSDADGARASAVYVCGGGAYNALLMQQLAAELGPQTSVQSTAALGVAPNHVEALAFAWLGQRYTARLAGNLPAVTGARGERILGALYPY
ncbi:anhydro-N-acetylmuramic acid kinase [Pseudoduganella sp. FT93W]|uniref:Anhydro-N-acetylmuramic acid kinase n=1 Tax=Duganella fentianensis TaxID=2692177 RepID=A0A845I678_9BURK|nr:anhydro-N-acetylmuramic acid kinase [Duganella fentianensis]MYN46848.1 anhydro-N-acetylmuramic acid kinase [Duganella fentianensis]